MRRRPACAGRHVRGRALRVTSQQRPSLRGRSADSGYDLCFEAANAHFHPLGHITGGAASLHLAGTGAACCAVLRFHLLSNLARAFETGKGEGRMTSRWREGKQGVKGDVVLPLSPGGRHSRHPPINRPISTGTVRAVVYCRYSAAGLLDQRAGSMLIDRGFQQTSCIHISLPCRHRPVAMDEGGRIGGFASGTCPGAVIALGTMIRLAGGGSAPPPVRISATTCWLKSAPPRRGTRP